MNPNMILKKAGRPEKNPEKKYITKRAYIKDIITLNFETQEEREAFYNKKENMQFKMGIKRHDKFFMKLMEDKEIQLNEKKAKNKKK